MNKKILIIGGCGYIGSELYSFLKTKYPNWNINTVDLEWFGNFSNKENFKIDFNTLNKADLLNYNSIILLAGNSSVKMCLNNLHSTFKNNVYNFIKLLEKISPVTNFIYASSSSIYGNINQSFIEENCREYQALNYYDLSKYEIDAYTSLYDKIPCFGLRFGTVNGPSVNFRNDVMINMMYFSAKKNGKVIINNPNIRRPILGINDLCNAIEHIILKGSILNRGIYNLASFNLNVKEIGSAVAKYMNVSLNYSKDMPNRYDFSLSTQKFKTIFNFQFKDNVNMILKSIIERDNNNSMNFSNRNNIINYD